LVKPGGSRLYACYSKFSGCKVGGGEVLRETMGCFLFKNKTKEEGAAVEEKKAEKEEETKKHTNAKELAVADSKLKVHCVYVNKCV